LGSSHRSIFCTCTKDLLHRNPNPNPSHVSATALGIVYDEPLCASWQPRETRTLERNPPSGVTATRRTTVTTAR
jgi:hypothetical protein